MDTKDNFTQEIIEILVETIIDFFIVIIVGTTFIVIIEAIFKQF
jgi:hypothetical protein